MSTAVINSPRDPAVHARQLQSSADHAQAAATMALVHDPLHGDMGSAGRTGSFANKVDTAGGLLFDTSRELFHLSPEHSQQGKALRAELRRIDGLIRTAGWSEPSALRSIPGMLDTTPDTAKQIAGGLWEAGEGIRALADDVLKLAR